MELLLPALLRVARPKLARPPGRVRPNGVQSRAGVAARACRQARGRSRGPVTHRCTHHARPMRCSY